MTLNDFPYVTSIKCRFSDVDAMGHVNNAVLVTYFEMGRVDFFAEVLGAATLDGIDFIMAHIEVDYLRPVLLGESLRLGVRIPSVGRTSFVFEYLLEADGEPAVSGRSVQVFFDYETRVKKTVPAAFKELAAPYMVSDESR
ncbi:MAG: thioesterase family protein [Acidobacteriota bacterium]